MCPYSSPYLASPFSSSGTLGSLKYLQSSSVLPIEARRNKISNFEVNNTSLLHFKMDANATNADVRRPSLIEVDGIRQRKKSVAVLEINGKHVNVDDMSDADAQLASQFGYKPIFKREFGYLSTFSFAVSISGLFATVMTTFSYPLYAGGAPSAVWCWLISGAGCMCIACSVAELVSAYPTSGGLYFTISRLAPGPWVPSISW